ncbi:dTDP-4-dehydrorhamnose reductase family protein [Paenibacillus sp. MMS18-CY102]|uniref:dTDP-4-dehydrorhamnose reductase family protein n=1 Tax=Paenibacillus sp. MMS18-CY102 TaxID=2682849 RepID=UPI0013656FF5|nr:SDR family oxidoreductase [Paenibacillus sp. MMS18-CY102]MWC28645.1 sugar nucleotide-binding protein [Paenibacillus sp. MMS18-CY102]
MKLLVIGGNGMAGHMIVRYFQDRSNLQVAYTTRRADDPSGIWLDAADYGQVQAVIQQEQPDIIINAVGVLNESAERTPLAAFQVNAWLPHWLRHLADAIGARVIHISSDCVFSGDRGSYTEYDAPEGTSMYARTKAMGESRDPRHLTIRTSIIGPDPKEDGIGLLQWFLKQKGEIRGYASVYWNGVTTLELAKAIAYAISHPEIGGLVQLTAPETVSKLELLRLFQQAFGHEGVTIVPAADPVIDRTLLATRPDWGHQAAPYREMLAELADWMRAR